MLLCARLLDLAYKDSAATPSAGLASGMRGVRSLSSQLNASSAERRAEYAHQAAMLCGLLAEALPDRTPSVRAHAHRDAAAPPAARGARPPHVRAP